MKSACFFLLSSSAAARSLSFDASSVSSKGNAVAKVVQLLKDMTTKLEEDAEKEKGMYDKKSCWCKNNIQDKTKSIADGNERSKYLTNHRETLTANLATWAQEAANLEKDIDKGKAAIDQAEKFRADQKKTFQSTEADMLETLNQLIDAESDIKKSVALVQTQQSKTALANTMVRLQKKVSSTAGLVALSDHNSNVDDFLKSPEYRQSSAFLQSFSEAPGASDVLGVVSGVKSDYVWNLKDLRQAETDNFNAHKKLIEAKTAELHANEKQLKAKKEAFAKGEEQKALEKAEMDTTKASIAEDTEFLADVKEKCRLVDKEWDERSKTRTDEMEAVAKATEVLNSDEARDTFTSTLSFLQVASDSDEKRRRAVVAAALEKVGTRLDVRLVTIAMRAKLDGFEKVKKAINEMVEALKIEQSNEVKKRDYCIKELNNNELGTQDKTQTKETLTAQIAELTAAMNSAKQQADSLQSEVSEMEEQVKLASQNREAENKEAQPVIKEHRVAQVILAKAAKVLKTYFTVPAAELIQVKKHEAGADPLTTEPEDFKEYKQNSGGFAVISLIDQLIQDSKVAEAQTMEAERQSQAAYEDLVQKTTESINTKKKAIVQLLNRRAKDEEAKMEATDAQTIATDEMKQLAVVNKQLHETCDWVMKNFEVTQQARSEEMDALTQAKGILSGDTKTGAE
eukprot:TRINITY_DN760_c0_g1_i3.p1 TRINITY_DN760_c0_g1~~TRINITY_DN760_c0_g1_i3.p1  ORF type:complete len:684 (-),score=251.89 TRINITY_DN760_c0_g1_i3:195-2246(-)